MSARKNRRARGRHARRVSFSRAFFLAPIYFLAPATQATAFPRYYSRNKEKEDLIGHFRVPNTLTFKIRPSTHSPAA